MKGYRHFFASEYVIPSFFMLVPSFSFTLLFSLSIFYIQDSFAFKVTSAYILKPDGFGGLHRASFSSSKFSFEVRLLIF